MGILIIFTGLLHGILSSFDVLSLNLGTILLVTFILLALSFTFRRIFKKEIIWIRIHRFLTALAFVLLIFHLVEVGGFVGVDGIKAALTNDSVLNDTSVTPSQEPVTDKTTTSSSTSGPYIDGTYTGMADGYRPGLTVEVVIENGYIASVKVVAHNKRNERFYGKPVELIPQEIVAAQSTDVDGVTGATFTSTGIKNAVNNALANALK